MLRRKVDESFKSNLTRIDGVANVEVWGGRERKILVDMDQSKLMALKVSYEDVMNVLGANNFNLLVGEIENEQDKLLIRTLGLFNSVEDIQQIGIAKSKENKIIRVKDVADVYDALCCRRCYKDPWDECRIVEELQRCSGTHFDPEVINAFFSCLDVLKSICLRYPDDEEKKG